MERIQSKKSLMTKPIIKAIIILTLLASIAIFFTTNLFAADVSTSASVTNAIPVASNAELNEGDDITLVANDTTSVSGTVLITDNNGCNEIKSVNATLFRTSLSGGDGAADNNRSHYTVVCTSDGDCDDDTDITESYTCEFSVFHFADPTDSGSLYPDTNWTFNVSVTDGHGGVSDFAQQDLLTLTSLTVTTSSISFGELALGENTSSTNQQTRLANTGNEGLDVEIKAYGDFEDDGYSMACSVGNIDVNYMQYSQNAFTYGSGTNMSDTYTEVDLDLDRGDDSTSKTPFDTIYYGLKLPTSGLSGSCAGTVMISASSDPTLD